MRSAGTFVGVTLQMPPLLPLANESDIFTQPPHSGYSPLFSTVGRAMSIRTPNGISVGLAAVAQLMVVTNRQTNTQTDRQTDRHTNHALHL